MNEFHYKMYKYLFNDVCEIRIKIAVVQFRKKNKTNHTKIIQ